jgi:cytochrome oxidase Cu insertion factor (SCO1/SenC/PrrC family)
MTAPLLAVIFFASALFAHGTSGSIASAHAPRSAAGVGQSADPEIPSNGEVLDSAGEIESFVPTMQAGDAIPDAHLVDQYGRPLSFRNGPNPTIVSFMETRCPDTRTCPLVTAKFSRMERIVRGTSIRLLEITLDPGYDRPSVLVRYAAAVGVSGKNWLLGTGSARDIAAISKRFGIFGDRTISGDIGHTEAVAILSGDGVLQTRIDGTDWSPDDVAARARDVAGLSSNPLRRLELGLFARVSAACGGNGAAGLPIVAALAMFGFLTISFGYIILRLFAPAFSDRS